MATTTRPPRLCERYYFRLLPFGDPPGTTRVPLPTRRQWPIGSVIGGMFLVVAISAAFQFPSVRDRDVRTIFDFMGLLFTGGGFLFLVGFALLLGALTAFILLSWCYVWIGRETLVYEIRIGPIRFFREYLLGKFGSAGFLGKEDDGRTQIEYGGRNLELGTNMHRSEADKVIRALRSAIDAVPRIETKAIAPSPHVAPLPVVRTAPPPAWKSPSVLALLAANLAPLAGLIFFEWNVREIMMLYWAESAVIGFYNVLKLAVISGPGVLFLAPLFVGHFGGFMAIHFFFLYSIFGTGVGAPDMNARPFKALAEIFVPLGPTLAAYFVSHGVSFYVNFLRRKEYAGRTAQQQMSEPYRRIVAMQLMIILGVWLCILLKSPQPMLILVIAVKTAMDLYAHRKERLRAAVPEFRIENPESALRA